jgi:hypothetical protein
MTGFAPDPRSGGKGFVASLPQVMEATIKKEGVMPVYTIARALSRPNNATLSGAGYQFGVLLPNNTTICGSMENMNVWYKKLE